MRIKLLYGEQEIWLDLPDHQVKGVLEAKPLPVASSEEALVREALLHPIDSAPLCELARSGGTACIVVGDMTRLWVRHHVLLPPILDELNKGGIPDRNICIISATGDHREQTPEEHRQLVGEEAYRRLKVYDHQARRQEDMVYLGTTSYGTPVNINKKVAASDKVILTGGIVYHFLAGWGGGKKAIIPGVSSYETIMKNHSLAFNPESGKGLNPSVCAGRLEGNPCSDDMVQGTSLVAPDFLINTIIDEDVNTIAHVVAGNYLSAYREGCRHVDNHFRVDINGPADLVIASCGGYPKDINLYQTYKTIYNAQFALRKGGTMILLSESREGLGNDDFADIFTSHGDNAGRETALREKYTIGGQMGYHAAVIAEENHVLALTSLPDDVVRSTGMIPVTSLEEALAFVRKKTGDIPPAYIIPHAGSTFPCMKSC
jgi:nickel-dependent lactate racemase